MGTPRELWRWVDHARSWGDMRGIVRAKKVPRSMYSVLTWRGKKNKTWKNSKIVFQLLPQQARKLTGNSASQETTIGQRGHMEFGWCFC